MTEFTKPLCSPDTDMSPAVKKVVLSEGKLCCVTIADAIRWLIIAPKPGGFPQRISLHRRAMRLFVLEGRWTIGLQDGYGFGQGRTLLADTLPDLCHV
jgi:hypothetical protein